MSQVTNGHESANGWRTQSMYSFSEAAHLADVSTTTVKNWLFGYTVKGREVPPLFPSDNGDMVSANGWRTQSMYSFSEAAT